MTTLFKSVLGAFVAVFATITAFAATEVTTEAALKDALAAGGEVTLGADIEVKAEIQIPAGITAVLDLNGKKITSGYQTGSTSKHIYPFNNYGTFTIKDLAGEGSITGRGIFVQDGSKLTIESGAVYAIDSNGGSVFFQYGGDIVINGGHIEQKAEGTYNFAINGLGGTVTVNNGWVGGNHGAIAAGGAAVVINGGTLVCTGTAGMSDNVLYSYDSGSIVINGGTFIADKDIPSGGCCVYDANGKVTINGGSFSNSSGGDVWGTTGTTIKGGTFENLIETSRVAVGATIVNGGKTYTKSESGEMVEATAVNVATLAELQAALASDSTLPIVITETIVIPTGETVELDLNGKTVSHTDEANKYAINNLGTLTLKDSKGNGSINARGIYNGYGNGGDNVATAKITVESGTYNAKGTNGGAAIFNYGEAYINGGNFTSIGGYSLNNQSGSSMTIADGVTANNGIYCSNAKVTVNGGNISGNRSGCHVVYAWNAELTINGGTFYNNNSGNATIMSAGTTKCTITGGTFGIKDGRVEGNGNTWTSCLTDTANTATMTVTGGTFNGGFRIQAGTTMTIEGGSFNDVGGSKYNIFGTVSVKGGTFTDATAKTFAANNLAAGYTLGENGAVVAPVAKIGEVYYTSLQAAINAAQEGDTITLISDINYVNVASQQDKTTSIYIPAGKKFTLDLNGYTISGENNVNGSFAFVTICRGADIIIDDTSANKSGKITYKSTREKSDYNQKGYTIGAMGTLALNGGTIENSTPLGSDGFEKCVTTAIDIAASNGEMASFTMNGGVVISETYFAIRANVYEGNKVNSENVVVLNAGTVHGLHFCDWGSKDLNYKVAIGKDAVIECGNYVDYPDQSIRLIIAGAAASEVSIDIAEEAQIKGSVYSPIAKVGKMYSYNLTKAIAAAQAGGTIELLKDVDLSEILTIDKSVTLDGNSKTLTSTAKRAINITCEGEVTIKNLNVVGDGNCERGINVLDATGITNIENVNVTVTGTKGTMIAVNAYMDDGNTEPLVINIKECNLTADYYAVQAYADNAVFNIVDSVVTGWAAIKVCEDNVTVNVTNSELIGINPYPAGQTQNEHSTVSITRNCDNVAVNVIGGSITAKSEQGLLQAIFGHNSPITAEVVLDSELILVGEGATYLDMNASEATVAVRAEYADEVAAEGFSVGSANENGLVSIIVPVAKIGEAKYASLAEALAAAQAGDTITLLGDCELVSGIDIDKNITVDGAGYKVYAADIADDTEMFNIRSKVTITNLTFDADHKFSYGIQVQDAADVTLSDVSILYAGNDNWGASVNLNGGKLFVSGDFTAFSGGENGGAFPFTGILYWGGDFKFADGVTASIADPTGATTDSDLLLVGTVGLLSIEDADEFLSQFNIPSGFAPYTLALDADIVSSFGGFTGASPLPWNTIIDYGKQILDAIGESTTETQVTVGLLDDTVIPDVFVYEDANFSINGNGKTLTGTIDVTDNVGTISNVVLTSGTTFVMTNVTTGCVKFGDNVTVSGQVTIVPPANYGVGSAPLIEFTDGSGIKPEDFVIDQSAVEIPEGTEFVVDGNKIVLGTPVAKIGDVKYASLLGAIAAAKSGDTVTLLGDCGITTGIILDKNITIDGGNFTLTAVSGDPSLSQMVRVDSAATIKNITLAVNHKYDYGIQMNNPASDLTLENVTILYAGKAEGHKNDELLFGASVFLQQGNLLVKGKFTAFSGGETAGTFPFTGILYWPAGGTTPTFMFADGATASIADPTGATSDSDLLLVGAPGILSVEDADAMLGAFNIPEGFAPYTLKLDCPIVQGVGGGFTGASPLAWNTIINYGKKILTVVNQSTTETQVEVGILDDVEIPEVFVYEDANFSINGNGKELKGTIDFTDNVGTISNVTLTSGMTFVMTNVTEGCVKLGEGVTITEPVKVIPPDNFGRGEDSATLIEFAEGSGLSLENFEIDTSTVQLPEGSQIVQDGNKIIVKLPIAQIGNRKFATLAEAFEAANDGDTVRVLYSFNTNETIVINKAITFDFSDDVITNTASGAAIQVAAEGVKFIGGELVAKGNGIEVAEGGSSVIERGVYEVTGDALAGAVTVSGGTFNKAANVINAFKSDDCEAVDNEDGWCTVMDYVAQFGEAKYVSIQAAIDAAAATNPTVDNPATVMLLGNVAGAVTLPDDVIISANGYTVQSVVDSDGHIVELHGGAYQAGKHPEQPPIRSIKIVGDKVQLSFVPRQILKTVVVEASSDLKTWTAMDDVTYVNDRPGKECVISVAKPQGNNAFFRVKFEYAD